MKFFKNPILLLLILLSSCTTKVLIDNPTDLDITVSVDGKDYMVAAYESQSVDLKKATVNVTSKDEEGNEFMNEDVEITGEGVLNATNSTYVIWNDIYCSPEDYERLKVNLDLKDIVIVNEKEYEEIDFTVLEDAFIPKNWNYGLDEIFPDSVDLVNDYAIKSKIYNVQELEDEFGYFGDLDFSEYEEEDINSFIDSLKQVLESEEE